jgi:hypothetical protein
VLKDEIWEKNIHLKKQVEEKKIYRMERAKWNWNISTETCWEIQNRSTEQDEICSGFLFLFFLNDMRYTCHPR